MRESISSLTRMSGPSRGWAKPSLPLLVATLSCLPLLIVHFQQLWSRPHTQYFPLVIVAVAILYQVRRTDPDRPVARPRPGLAGLTLMASLCLATYAVLQISPLLAYAAWLLTGVAFVARSGVNLWSQWGLLCLLLRLPQGRDVQLIQWLQTITTRISSGVLEQLQIDHFQTGNVLEFPDRKLFVEAACSGVVSLYTIVATAAICGAFLRRTGFHTLLLMLAGAFWAGAANILRVVAIAVFVEKMGIDLTQGWPHDLLGLAIFCVTLVTLFSTDAMLRFLFGPIGVEADHSTEPMEGNSLTRLWNWLFWPNHERPVEWLADRPEGSPSPVGRGWKALVSVTSVGFLSLGALQVWGGIGPFSTGLGIGKTIDELSKDSLPAELVGWTLTDFRRENRSASSEFGERSRQWTYRRGDQTVVASVDYPFPEWHDLDVCYRGLGWTADSRTRLPEQFTALQYTLHQDQQAGWLIFDLFDQQGAPYQPPSGRGIHPRWRRLFSGDSSRWTLPTYYQVQILAVGPRQEPVDLQAVTELQQFFTAFRESIRQQSQNSVPAGPP
jgi:exosortase